MSIPESTSSLLCFIRDYGRIDDEFVYRYMFFDSVYETLTTKNIWVKDVISFNDSLELYYGKTVLLEFLFKLKNSSYIKNFLKNNNAQIELAIKGIEEVIRDLSNYKNSDVFVLCLSREFSHENYSKYGDSCIKLHLGNLITNITDCVLDSKVFYSKEERDHILEDEGFKNYLINKIVYDNDVDSIKMIMQLMLPLFKEEHWSEEKEFRFIFHKRIMRDFDKGYFNFVYCDNTDIKERRLEMSFNDINNPVVEVDIQNVVVIDQIKVDTIIKDGFKVVR